METPQGVEVGPGDPHLGFWEFVYDNDDDIGGFASGQFLLRPDGTLLRRMGWSSYGTRRTVVGEGSPGDPDEGVHVYRYLPWQLDRRWNGTDPAACATFLQSRGYDLEPPSPTAPHEDRSGLFPGYP
jgi:hypothetical protein